MASIIHSIVTRDLSRWKARAAIKNCLTQWHIHRLQIRQSSLAPIQISRQTCSPGAPQTPGPSVDPPSLAPCSGAALLGNLAKRPVLTSTGYRCPASPSQADSAVVLWAEEVARAEPVSTAFPSWASWRESFRPTTTRQMSARLHRITFAEECSLGDNHGESSH
jgi:hypothetical protein